MGDISYSNGRFGGKERTGFRFQSWSSNDGDGIDRWNKPPLATYKTEVRQDHVCKPVLIGSDGKIIPAVFEYPPQTQKDGGLGRWDQSGDAFSSDAYKRRWDPSGDAFRSDAFKTQTFFSNIQTTASASDPRFGLPKGNTFPLQKPEYGSYDGVDAYGQGRRIEGYNSSGWGSRPNDAWGRGATWRPGRGSEWGGAVEGQLGRATNDIETATEILREFMRPAAAGEAMDRPNPWKPQTPAAGFNPPSTKTSTTSSVIDSKEAAKKYGGQFIW